MHLLQLLVGVALLDSMQRWGDRPDIGGARLRSGLGWPGVDPPRPGAKGLTRLRNARTPRAPRVAGAGARRRAEVVKST